MLYTALLWWTTYHLTCFCSNTIICYLTVNEHACYVVLIAPLKWSSLMRVARLCMNWCMLWQIDELVVQAFKLKATSKHGRKEIESFTHFLSEMLSSLKVNPSVISVTLSHFRTPFFFFPLIWTTIFSKYSHGSPDFRRCSPILWILRISWDRLAQVK